MEKKVSLLFCFLAIALITFHQAGLPLVNAASKVCRGGRVDRNNVKNFTGCQIIDGSLAFISGIPSLRNSMITNVSDLNVFESVEEITGYLLVYGIHPDINTLSFFRNLKVVSGRTLVISSGLSRVEDAFVIRSTGLVELGLTSLKEISRGNVVIEMNNHLERLGLVSLETIEDGAITIWNNSNLCYVDSINWTQIGVNRTRMISVKINANKTHYCEPNGKVCSSQCSSDGCWGPTNEDCRYCAGYRFGLTCVESCQFQKGPYAEEVDGIKQCQRCHEECLDSCDGGESSDCEVCRHVRDGLYCRANCPAFKYANASGECEPCFEDCKDGCTGPGDHLGFNGCNSCHLALVQKDKKPVCLQNDSQCPDDSELFHRWLNVETQNGTQKVRLDVCEEKVTFQENTFSTEKYLQVTDRHISISSDMKLVTSVSTVLPDDTGTEPRSNYWFVASLSLAAVVSILLVLMAIMCRCFYIRRKRISAGVKSSVNASSFASLDHPISDVYEIMPYAYTDGYDAYDEIEEDIIETDLDVPISPLPKRGGPLPTPGYDSLLPRPSTLTVYYAIDTKSYEQPMDSNDIEIIPGHESESELYSDTVPTHHGVNVDARDSSYLQLITLTNDEQPMNRDEINASHTSESELYSDTVAIQHGVNVSARDSSYLQLISGEQLMNSNVLSAGHGSESELCSESDTSVKHGIKLNAKHSAYIELIGDTEREDTSPMSPTFSTVSVARNEINRSSITSNDSANEIPSSYLQINKDATEDDSSEEIPSSYLKINEDVSEDDT